MTSKPDDDPLATGGGISFFQSLSAAEDARFIGRILGDYRIVELIGQGGMSRVFRGERAAHGRPVTLPASAASKLPREIRLIVEQCLRPIADDKDLQAGLMSAAD